MMALPSTFILFFFFPFYPLHIFLYPTISLLTGLDDCILYFFSHLVCLARDIHVQWGVASCTRRCDEDKKMDKNYVAYGHVMIDIP